MHVVVFKPKQYDHDHSHLPPEPCPPVLPPKGVPFSSELPSRPPKPLSYSSSIDSENGNDAPVVPPRRKTSPINGERMDSASSGDANDENGGHQNQTSPKSPVIPIRCPNYAEDDDDATPKGSPVFSLNAEVEASVDQQPVSVRFYDLEFFFNVCFIILHSF